MVEMILFHHAQGLTPGVLSFADRLRAAGHRVTAPDLYSGATFPTVDEGVAHARQVGFHKIVDVGVAAAEALPERIVYAGFSLGVMTAQQLAQTRPGALGALFYHAAILPSEFGGSWPAGLPLQIHVNEHDELGDVDVAGNWSSKPAQSCSSTPAPRTSSPTPAFPTMAPSLRNW